MGSTFVRAHARWLRSHRHRRHDHQDQSRAHHRECGQDPSPDVLERQTEDGVNGHHQGDQAADAQLDDEDQQRQTEGAVVLEGHQGVGVDGHQDDACPPAGQHQAARDVLGQLALEVTSTTQGHQVDHLLVGVAPRVAGAVAHDGLGEVREADGQRDSAENPHEPVEGTEEFLDFHACPFREHRVDL